MMGVNELTNFMAYGTQMSNAEFTRTPYKRPFINYVRVPREGGRGWKNFDILLL